MKTIKLLTFILLIGFAFNSCEIEPDHSIRVKNNYSETINDVTIGSVSYGDVGSGTTTEYKPVEEGDHTLSGNTDSGGSLSGNVSVTGNGIHKWTLTITSSGDLEIAED